MRIFLLLVATALSGFALSDDVTDIRLAKQYFAEARVASDEDKGALWGKTIYGPMIFVDAATKTVYANQADKDGTLKAQDGIFVGKVGSDFPVANTSHTLGGTSFMVIPFDNMPDNLVGRRSLMMHESFHRIQDSLGLPAAQVRNAHLDEKDGRIWLRLEWRALSIALVSWGPERTQAIQDALTFRAYRRSLYDGAAQEEDRMEIHEGMAEYTGIVLDGMDNQSNRWHMAGRLKINALKPSYSYSFAYETGPAYGLLLDMTQENWRKDLKTTSSLSDLVAATIHFEAHEHMLDRVERANAYHPVDIFDSEEKRAKDREAAAHAYRELLVTGPILELPLEKSNFTFNPNAVVPMGSDGNVYPTATISAEWGTIKAEKGARIALDFRTAWVSAPTSPDRLKGDGWTLELKAGWRVQPTKNGSFTLVKG